MENLIYIILFVILIVIIIILIMYNKLVRLQNRVKKAQANIDVCLNKRFDLIPNIVECVKSYSKYESTTLEEITSLRTNYTSQKNMTIKEASEMNNKLNHYLAIVENYPELKANSEYMSLQNKLSEVEEDLQRVRHYYNDEVTRYNTTIESVPSNIVAAMFAFKQAELFQIDEPKKENINIDLEKNK